MVLLITCNIFDLPKFQNRSVGELAYRGVFFFDIDTTPSDLHYGTCKAIFANEIDRTSEDPSTHWRRSTSKALWKALGFRL